MATGLEPEIFSPHRYQDSVGPDGLSAALDAERSVANRNLCASRSGARGRLRRRDIRRDGIFASRLLKLL
jgi:hypothetical protein